MAETAQVTEEQQTQESSPSAREEKTPAQSVEFPQAVDSGEQPGNASFDILMDMNIPVTVTVGRTDISIKRLLQLGPGSVVVLDRSVDTPVELYLKDAKFATGDIVVVDEKFAVRIRQILNVAPQQGDKDNDPEKKQNGK